MLDAERRSDFQYVLQFIEQHLTSELSLDGVAEHMAISKYHFHRLFHSFVGSPFASYVRKRRLSNAASELLTTKRRILDIALDYQFESQEAFTRAFKKMFQMTPGQYRSFIHTIVQKKEREQQMNSMNNVNTSSRDPYGWMLSGTHPSDYEMGIDFSITHHGKASGYLRSQADNVGGFATMMQVFKAHHYRGQRLQFTGFLKTEQVDSMCGLWMRVDGKDQEILQFDNMSNRPVSGSTDWTRYHIVLDVPKDSEAISFGVLLNGKGKVWIDSLQFEAVSDQVPTTNMEEDVQIPEHPVNLSFEQFEQSEAT